MLAKGLIMLHKLSVVNNFSSTEQWEFESLKERREKTNHHTRELANMLE